MGGLCHTVDNKEAWECRINGKLEGTFTADHEDDGGCFKGFFFVEDPQTREDIQGNSDGRKISFKRSNSTYTGTFLSCSKIKGKKHNKAETGKELVDEDWEGTKTTTFDVQKAIESHAS